MSTHVVVDEEKATRGDTDDVGARPLQLFLRDFHRNKIFNSCEGLQKADELSAGDEGLQSFGPRTEETQK
jgi:hypothetical protein